MAGKLFILKIGSSLLTKNNQINVEYINSLARSIYENVLENKDKIIIVSSGAIAGGMGLKGLKRKPTKISKKQALAAIGQTELMNIYKKAFARYTVQIAQVLLTKLELDNRESYKNIKNTLFELLDMNFIPIINENDTVSISEIKFGDNDTLSAIVASRVNASLLVILTDVDGLYNFNPKIKKDATLIKTVKLSEFDNLLNSLDLSSSKKTGSTIGTGGMATKLKAAKISCTSGVPVLITNGKLENIKVLFKDLDNGTKFIPDKKVLTERERWFLYNTHVMGYIYVDSGAEEAIKFHGKSLLSPGIIKVEGDFSKGDIVDIKNSKNIIFARGIAEYNAFYINNIKGLNKEDLTKKNLFPKNIIIHRDNMALL